MEIVLLGHMGRDEALAERLMHHRLHIIGQWRNPGLVAKAEQTGGSYHLIDSIKNVDGVANIVQDIEPNMFITNFDDALAAGVVDTIRQRVDDKLMSALMIPCPTKEAARVEWDKFFLRELVDPKYNPDNFMVKNPDNVEAAIDHFGFNGKEIVIKPRNLTGGKGVKVQGKHFDTLQEGGDYARRVLADDKQTGVEIQEKLEGPEFTLQLITDGHTLIRPPLTVDYPYRLDGDKGGGTGGMGTFSLRPGELPEFLTQEDYDEAVAVMESLLGELQDRGLDYKGVLYPTFIKTAEGLKIVEVNARAGDPEFINIMDTLEDDVDMFEVLRQIEWRELDEKSVRFKDIASTMVYMVAPEYGQGSGDAYEFTLDPAVAAMRGCKLRFAAAELIGGNLYRTVGTSRAVGLSALGKTPWEARATLHAAIREAFGKPLALQYRRDIGDEAYIRNLGR